MFTPLKKPTQSQNTSAQGEAASPVSSDGAAETARGHHHPPIHHHSSERPLAWYFPAAPLQPGQLSRL